MRLILLFLFISSLLQAQIPDKIRIKKEDEFYFFQVGKKTDTISSQNDKFYLKITGKTRCETRIGIVNGRLYQTANDTIFQLKKNPNLQYEHYFSDSVFVANRPKNQTAPENCFKFITHINGAQEGDGNTITIQFYNINTRQTLLKNTFYYK